AFSLVNFYISARCFYRHRMIPVTSSKAEHATPFFGSRAMLTERIFPVKPLQKNRKIVLNSFR
ncbi:MAG: hypothetical protein ACRCXF_07965, partial [Plesiomonas shigelloides]